MKSQAEGDEPGGCGCYGDVASADLSGSLQGLSFDGGPKADQRRADGQQDDERAQAIARPLHGLVLVGRSSRTARIGR